MAAGVPVDLRPAPVVPECVGVGRRADAVAERAYHEPSLARHEGRTEERRVNLPELAKGAATSATHSDTRGLYHAAAKVTKKKGSQSVWVEWNIRLRAALKRARLLRSMAPRKPGKSWKKRLRRAARGSK